MSPCPPPGLACPGSERQLVNFIRVVSRVQLCDLRRPHAAGVGVSIVLSIRATSENIPSVYSWRLLRLSLRGMFRSTGSGASAWHPRWLCVSRWDCRGLVVFKKAPLESAGEGRPREQPWPGPGVRPSESRNVPSAVLSPVGLGR